MPVGALDRLTDSAMAPTNPPTIAPPPLSSVDSNAPIPAPAPAHPSALESSYAFTIELT